MRRLLAAGGALAAVAGCLLFAVTGSAVPPATGLMVGSTTSNSVTVAWQPSQGATGYRVLRDGVLVSTLSASASQYRFRSLSWGEHVLGVEPLPDGGVSTLTVRGEWRVTGSSVPTPPPPSEISVAPGQSWQAAYDAAPSGAAIQVQAGNHGEQTLAGTKPVVFVGVDGARLMALIVNASNVTVDNVDIDGDGDRYTILQNSGDNNTFRNLEVRDNTDAAMVGNYGAFGTYDTVVFRDAVMTAAGEAAGVHMECMWSNGPTLTVRNSVFRDCAVMDLFLTRGDWWGQPNVCCVVLADNVFWPSERTNNTGVHFYTVQVHDNADSVDGYQWRRNRFDLPVNLGDNPVANSVFCSNSGQVPDTWKVAC